MSRSRDLSLAIVGLERGSAVISESPFSYCQRLQTETQVVVLHIREGSQRGLSVILQRLGAGHSFESYGLLRDMPPELFEQHAQWRSIYRKCLNASFQLNVPQITNFGRQDFQNCLNAADQLQQTLQTMAKCRLFPVP